MLVVAHRPLEGGLQLEALALAFFVVRGDALGRLGGDVLDAVDVADDLGVAERRAAGVAHRRLFVEVPGAAALADADRSWSADAYLAFALSRWPSDSSARTTR